MSEQQSSCASPEAKSDAVEYREIVLRGGEIAMIDADDYLLVANYAWRVLRNYKTGTCYAQANVYRAKPKRTVLMHRLILGLTDPRIEGDHRDGNGLNNRRNNLRIATRRQNGRNRIKRGKTASRFKGVGRRRSGWEAHIVVDGRLHDLGTFTVEEDAAKAYDSAAREFHGDFARLNFSG